MNMFAALAMRNMNNCWTFKRKGRGRVHGDRNMNLLQTFVNLYTTMSEIVSSCNGLLYSIIDWSGVLVVCF